MKQLLLSIGVIYSSLHFAHAQCFTKIVSGEQHTIALADDGTLWGWGSNTSGECGIITIPQGHILTPTQIGTDIDWVDFDCGGYHTMALKSNGDLYAWGYNSNGQLGTGDYNTRYEPAFISGGWKAIGCGSYTSYAVATNGNLYGCGDNSYNQLGIITAGDYNALTLVDGATDWKDAVGGLQYGAALKNDGTLYATGNNDFGQFGNGGYASSTTFMQVTSITDFTDIDAGFYHTVGLTSQNYLYSWGGNSNGQVGNGSSLMCADPYSLATNITGFACGENSTIYHTGTSVYTCGKNGYYQADPTTTNDVLSPYQWPQLNNPQLVTMGIFSSSVVTSTGLATWGRNDRGVCGDGTTTNVVSPAYVLNCSPAGLEEMMSTLTVYPNPSSQILNVILEQPEAVSIIDQTGRLVMRSVSKQEHHLSVSTLSNGIYLLQTESGLQSKFIKQ